MRGQAGQILPGHRAAGTRNGRAAARRGLTLLEVILALTLTIMLMAAVMMFYQSSLSARDKGRGLALEAIQMRSILERMAEELRHALPVDPGDGRRFGGTRDSITIVRSRLTSNYAFDKHETFENLPPAQMDLMRVTYNLYWDEEERVDEEGIRICYGIWRTEQHTFDPNPRFSVASDEPGAEEVEENLDVPRPDVNELYAPEVKYLRFEYFDGLNWQDDWNVQPTGAGGGSGGGGIGAGGGAGGSDDSKALPQAVRITIGRIREPPEEDLDLEQMDRQREEREKRVHHPDRFTTVVYLPQSDQSLLSSRKKGAAAARARQQMGEQTTGAR